MKPFKDSPFVREAHGIAVPAKETLAESSIRRIVLLTILDVLKGLGRRDEGLVEVIGG